MATDNLRQRIKLSGGQLAETSTEELTRLAGRPIQPSSPMETGVIGGNADQAKMAGTPAQRISSLRQALQGQEPQELGTRLRREQVRREATAEEQQRLTGAERLQQLGSLDSRVQQLAEQALTAAPADVQLEARGESEQVNQLLTRLQQNPNDAAALIELNRLSGRTDPADLLSAEELKAQFGGESEIIQEQLGKTVQEQINTGALNFTDMGFESEEEVAALLGTDAATLQGMTIGQLSDQLNSQIAQEYDQVSSLQQRASDPALGAAERAEARKQLRDLGAVGVRSAESDIDELADSVAQAETIKVLDEEIQIEDMLDNEYISGLIFNYLEDPNFAEKLKKDEPELAEFIDKYQNVLADSVANLDTAVANLAKVQQENLALADTPAGTIDDDIMKEWIPNYGEVSAEKYEAPPVLQMFQSNAYLPEQKINLKQSLDDLKAIGGPEYIRELGGLSELQIKQLGLTDTTSNNYKRLRDYLINSKKLEQIQPENAEDVAELFGESNFSTIRQNLAEGLKRTRSGLFDTIPGTAQFDFITNQKTDNASAQAAGFLLKKAYLPDGQRLGLRELISTPAPQLLKDYQSLQNNIQTNNSLYNLVSPAFEKDARIDNTDLQQIQESADLGQLNQLYNNATLRTKISAEDFKGKMQRAAQAKMKPDLDKMIWAASGNQYPNYEDAQIEMDKPQHYTDPNLFKLVSPRIENYITTLKQNRNAIAPDDQLTRDTLDNLIKITENKFNQFKQKFTDNVRKTDEARRAYEVSDEGLLGLPPIDKEAASEKRKSQWEIEKELLGF